MFKENSYGYEFQEKKNRHELNSKTKIKKHVHHNGYIYITAVHRDRESKPIVFDSTYYYNKVHPPSLFLDLDLITSRTISMKITSTFLLVFAEVS